MEDFNGLLLIIIFVWGSYILGIMLHLGIMAAGILGWTKKKNRGFICILISGCMGFLLHLPSIYFKGFYAVRRLPAEEYGKLMMNWTYIDNIAGFLARIVLVIGLLLVAIKGPGEKNKTLSSTT
jgi:hypothetical protein